MTDRYATVPAQARDFQGQRAGIVTRVAAAAVDFLIVIVAICLIYGGIAGVTFIIHPRSFHWPSNTGWTVPVALFRPADGVPVILVGRYRANLRRRAAGRTGRQPQGCDDATTRCDPACRSLRRIPHWLALGSCQLGQPFDTGPHLPNVGYLRLEPPSGARSLRVKRLGRCRGPRSAVNSRVPSPICMPLNSSAAVMDSTRAAPYGGRGSTGEPGRPPRIRLSDRRSLS